MKVGFIGIGTMGVGIIAMFLGGGWKVDVVSRSAGTRNGLPAACAKALAAMGKNPDTSGLKTYATLPEAAWDKITIAVETVTEDLALKRRLFAEMEALAHVKPLVEEDFTRIDEHFRNAKEIYK
mgnify:CR=1 FL=1